MGNQVNNTIFENGATWLRADFHLHTKADVAFNYTEDPNYFVSKYITQLKKEEIKIAVITNHNKFDVTEFKELRKNAEREEIYLLPGVEFSAKDGSKGLHILIVFDDSWIYNSENKNYIQSFLESAFAGVTNYDKPPYDNSKLDLTATYNLLNEYHKDYFFIMAHVDDSSGLFLELTGRNIKDCLESECFTKKVLGLQKSRSNENRKKLKEVLGTNIPALVEGTDNAEKGIEGIGLGNEISGVTQKTFIKIGSYNFDALKYALTDHANRVSAEKPEIKKAYLKSITFTTSKWKERKLSFNPAMNNLIGIRGSGKSTVLETVRYALDIPIGRNAHEQQYKERLVQHFLGSGGKMAVEMVDALGKTYIGERIYGDSMNIYTVDPSAPSSKELIHNLKASAIIKNALYYGQKDLSDIGGETSTEDLISKLTGDKLSEIKHKTDEQVSLINTIITDIQKADKQLTQKEDIEAKKAAIENDMKIFKKLEIDKKLNKQLEFDTDGNRLNSIIEFEGEIIDAVQELYDSYKDSFAGYKEYASKENIGLFTEVYATLDKFHQAFLQLNEILKQLTIEKGNLEKLRSQFSTTYELLKEEFSEIKRTINLPDIKADTYIKLSKELDLQNSKLVEIKKLDERKKQLTLNLKKALTDLRNLWHEEYLLVKAEIDKLNANQSAIKIEIEYRGNKDKFKEFLRDSIRGSNVREAAVNEIVDKYTDLIGVYEDFAHDDSIINQILSGGNNLSNFTYKFQENIKAFLTFRVPDKFVIYYKDRPLHEHSLGQRASALILFILTLKENDLIIIDQPEDDLDNQTIYTDVIRELKKIKDKTQFIFATHNPNIPVLGDCEQVISCAYSKEETVETDVGSIDDMTVQKQIVNIMEGGEEAFNQRKRIYELWKH